MKKNIISKTVTKVKANQSASFFYASLILLILSTSLLIIALKTQADSKRLYSYSADPARPFKVGQEVHMGNVALTLQNVEFAKGQPHFTAPAGKSYMVVNLTVKNRSEKPINVAPSSDTYVKGPAGHVSYLTPYALINPFRAGEVSPGEQIEGQLSYLVPKNAKLKFFVDAIWSGGVLSFAIN
jgi:hypothetical protein